MNRSGEVRRCCNGQSIVAARLRQTFCHLGFISTTEDTECRRVVFEFANAINDWEIREYILCRVAIGKHVSPARTALVAGLTKETHAEEHKDIFRRYIYPRERKYGTTPGHPAMIGRDGRFYDVRFEAIQSVTFRNTKTAEIVTDWGHLVPGGPTMFVLKKEANVWLIGSLKSKDEHGGWHAVPV